jgi:hypothetical protein
VGRSAEPQAHQAAKCDNQSQAIFTVIIACIKVSARRSL